MKPFFRRNTCLLYTSQPDEPDGGTLGELVPDSRAADAIENVEESVYREQLHKAIDGAISELPPGNAQLRYWDDMTLSAVGEVMGKSPERTRQMESKGIRELRKSRTLHRFLDFDMSVSYTHLVHFLGGSKGTVAEPDNIAVTEMRVCRKINHRVSSPIYKVKAGLLTEQPCEKSR